MSRGRGMSTVESLLVHVCRSWRTAVLLVLPAHCISHAIDSRPRVLPLPIVHKVGALHEHSSQADRAFELPAAGRLARFAR